MSQMTLRQHRLVREISKEEMAQKLGVHINTYSNWENEPQKISIEAAYKICNIFGITPDMLIFLPSAETNCFK